MATSYTTLLGLALPATGDLSGTWGATVNDYISTYLDSSIAGALTVTTDTTLTKTTGSSLGSTSSQYAIIIASPASANITITAPAASKAYIINNTSGAYTVTIRGAGPTTGVTLLASEKAIVAWNGSDFVKVASTSSSVINAGTLAVANGGTGVTTSTGSGSVVLSTSPTLVTPALGTPSSGALTNCTFPTLNQNTTGTAAGLSSTLAVSSGGTGLSSTPANGALDIGNGSGFTRTTLTAGSGISITNASGGITITNTSGSSGGTVTSVSGTGTVNGISLSGTVTSSGNLTLGGTLSGVNLASQVTGVLPIANGGTGSSSATFVNLATNVTGTLPAANGGTGASGSTGSGNAVLSNSPTLVTPILGTPQSGDFSTGTFTWPTFNQNTTGTAFNVTGTVAAANGGTGLTSPGTVGNVLTSNGSAWVSSAPSGGGGMTLISTQTVSGSSISWTGLSGYNNYLLIFNNVTTAGSFYTITLSVGTGSGPTYLSSNYNYVNSIDEGQTLTNIIQSQNGAGNILLTGINYTGRVSGSIYLNNFTNGLYFSSSGILSTSTTSPAIANTNSGIHYTSTDQKTAIKLGTSGLTFGSGTVSLYGISS
jgi:hypothetical protein